MQRTAVHSIPVYEVRPRKDHRGVDLISDVIRVYDAAGNVIETHQYAGDFSH